MPGKPTVLVIDEDLDSRVEVRKALQRTSFESVGEVGFGTEAITSASSMLPDVVLIAVEEPVVRPLETAESLANILPNTPFIFYASLTDPQAVRRAALYGARDYLLKPLQPRQLEEALERALVFEEKRHMRHAGQLASTPINGTVIAVTGAKGGIGKSVLSVNLALALKKQTRGRVVLIDADTHFGDVATMLDVWPERSASDLLRNIEGLDQAWLEECLTATPHGISILATPHDDAFTWEAAGPEAAPKIINALSRYYDFIVVDTSGAMDRYIRAVLDVSTLVLVVTTGEVSSVRDTKAALERMKRWAVAPEKVKLVLNRGARADGFQVSDLEKVLEIPTFWEMPRDREVGRSVQVGRPVVIDRPNTPAARSISALGAAIGGNVRVEAPVKAAAARKQGWLRARSSRRATP